MCSTKNPETLFDLFTSLLEGRRENKCDSNGNPKTYAECSLSNHCESALSDQVLKEGTAPE